MAIEQEKEKIRTAIREKLHAQTTKERAQKSNLIATKLQKDGAFKQATTVMFYYSTEEEVQTQGLISKALSEGKKVLLPCVDKNADEIRPVEIKNLEQDLAVGSYSIMEPKPRINSKVSMNEIDLVIVPGLAFDQARYRLGRGGGFYDRFLSKLPRNVVMIGLAFNFQIVKTLPVTELDIQVTRVIHS